MVVDTVGEGKTCFEYLRANDLGRAPFVIPEKLSDSDRMTPINTPEGVPRLFNLVKPKDLMYRKAFHNAFHNALGDTLVTNDLDQANRIAFSGKRYRVVALVGQVIKTFGAMSGDGGQHVGAMSAKMALDSVCWGRLEVRGRCGEGCGGAEEDDAGMHEAEVQAEPLKRMGPEFEMSY